MSDARQNFEPFAATTREEGLDPQVARAERRLRLLEELAEIGMELARSLKPGAAPTAEALDDKAPAKVRDPADVFASLSRAIRLTFALEAKTDQELRVLKVGVEPARRAARDLAIERDETARSLHELTVKSRVFDAAMAECECLDELHGIDQALSERLSDDEAYNDIFERPLRETVERLCKDLTLNPDWSQWGDDNWKAGAFPLRTRFSLFHTPSARPFLVDADGQPLETPAPPWRLHSPKPAATHELE